MKPLILTTNLYKRLNPPNIVPLGDGKEPTLTAPSVVSKSLDSWNSDPLPRPPAAPRRSRSRIQRQTSGSNVASSAASPNNSDRSSQGKNLPYMVIAAMTIDAIADALDSETSSYRADRSLCT